VSTIQAVWADIGVAETERALLLKKISLSPINCAKHILGEASASQALLKQNNATLTADMQTIAQVFNYNCVPARTCSKQRLIETLFALQICVRYVLLDYRR